MAEPKPYTKLLHRPINLVFNADVVNTFKITQITPTESFMVGLEGEGRVYNCVVDFEKKDIAGDIHTMDFAESIFNELLQKGESSNVFTPEIKFVLV